MDETDRRLLALLRHDSRASITTLAAELGVSRVTVQSRLTRLRSNGTVRKFTIEVGNAEVDDLIRAVMMIEVSGTPTSHVVKRLRRMPEIADLHTTNGLWDLVAFIEVANLPEFDRVLRVVREISGVTKSETSLLLDRARSQ